MRKFMFSVEENKEGLIKKDMTIETDKEETLYEVISQIPQVSKDFINSFIQGDIEVPIPGTKQKEEVILGSEVEPKKEYLVDRLPTATEIVEYLETNKKNSYLHSINDVQKHFLGQIVRVGDKQGNIYSRFYIILKEAHSLFLEKNSGYELETFTKKVRSKGRMVRRSYYKFVPKSSKVLGKREEIKIPTKGQITKYLEAIGDANPNFYHTFKDCQIYFIGRVLNSNKDPDRILYHIFYWRFYSVHRDLAKKYNGKWQRKWASIGGRLFCTYTLEIEDKDGGDFSIDEILGEEFGDDRIEEITG